MAGRARWRSRSISPPTRRYPKTAFVPSRPAAAAIDGLRKGLELRTREQATLIAHSGIAKAEILFSIFATMSWGRSYAPRARQSGPFSCPRGSLLFKRMASHAGEMDQTPRGAVPEAAGAATPTGCDSPVTPSTGEGAVTLTPQRGWQMVGRDIVVALTSANLAADAKPIVCYRWKRQGGKGTFVKAHAVRTVQRSHQPSLASSRAVADLGKPPGGCRRRRRRLQGHVVMVAASAFGVGADGRLSTRSSRKSPWSRLPTIATSRARGAGLTAELSCPARRRTGSRPAAK